MSVEDAPLYAVVYTDIARDGMLNGPNFDALAEFRAGTRLNVRVLRLAQFHDEKAFSLRFGDTA